MSGHSKWSTIKRKKGAADAKRGKLFTKLIREIATAASLGGGNPDSNPRLRLAVARARAASMPKDNIERAIHKGTGQSSTSRYEEVTYEGYGPAGVALLLRVLTDNRNRAVGEIRRVFAKNGGNLGETGCVSYLFEACGVITLEGDVDADRVVEVAVEAGAEDVTQGEDGVEVLASPAALEEVREAVEVGGFRTANAELAMRPTTTVQVTGRDAEAVLRLAEQLEDLDDVQDVYANFEVARGDAELLAGP